MFICPLVYITHTPELGAYHANNATRTRMKGTVDVYPVHAILL